MLTLTRNGRELRRVRAIKTIKSLTHWDLKDSKDVIDRLDQPYSSTTIAIDHMPTYEVNELWEAGVDVTFGANKLETEIKGLIHRAVNEKQYALACRLIDVLSDQY